MRVWVPVQAFAATAEDLDALESHPLDAEDEEVVDSVPRCMESVMLDAADGDAREVEVAALDAELLGLQVRSHAPPLPRCWGRIGK